MRIKLIKDYKEHKKGDVIDVSKNVGFGLIDSGVGIVSREITDREIKTKKVKYGYNS